MKRPVSPPARRSYSFHISLVFVSISLLILLACVSPALRNKPTQKSLPPDEPLLRLETGTHTAVIRSIAVDQAGKTLVTVSEDKTIRVWDLMDGRLKQTLRVPIDQGNSGKLYAVALSPDGQTVAAGGWTETNCIYLFKLPGGELVRQIKGLPEVLSHLVFSPDGRHLAASIVGKNGLQVYRAADGIKVAEAAKYANHSYWVDFDSSGRLVTTCYDGYLRLYNADFKLIAKRKAPGGKQPYSAVFSPDGRRIAVGYSDTRAVDVLSGDDLKKLFSPDTKGITNGNLDAVAWSADGSRLYAAGRYFKSGTYPVRYWRDGGRGRYEDLTASNNAVMNLVALSDGQLVFSAADPAWGVIDGNGNKGLYQTPQIADFRDNDTGFRVSKTGDRVHFGFKLWGKDPAVFSISQRTLTRDAEPSGLAAPRTSAPRFAVTDWKHAFDPQLNGRSLNLKKHEQSHSLAISPDRSCMLLGTEWYLRCYERSGRLRWKTLAQAATWGVNVTGNGRLAVAALGDGTIRWYRMADGKELLALFPHSDQKRWVLWTPSGYYAASAAADSLIGWHVNRGLDQAPDFFPVGQFRSTFYRPDVTTAILASGDEAKALHLADANTNRRPQPADVKSLLPPVVRILSPEDGSVFTSTEVNLRYQVRNPTGEPVTRVRFMVDGSPVSVERGIAVKEAAGLVRQIQLPRRDCILSLVAENPHAASTPAMVRLKWQGTEKEFTVKPKLYVLAVGVGVYPEKDLLLEYPAKDAQDIVAALKRQQGRLYKEVVARVLTDSAATKDDVLDGLEWLERQVTARDLAVLFLAGHGINDRNGNFYFLPGNGEPGSLLRTGVSDSDIRRVICGLPGKVLFFIDACHSGNVMGSPRRAAAADIDQVANDFSAAENGIIVFASSTGRQYSLENPAWGNGAFTKAVVEGLTGKADIRDKGEITVSLLEYYISERVKELTNGQQTPTTAKPVTVPDFPIAVR